MLVTSAEVFHVKKNSPVLHADCQPQLWPVITTQQVVHLYTTLLNHLVNLHLPAA